MWFSDGCCAAHPGIWMDYVRFFLSGRREQNSFYSQKEKGGHGNRCFHSSTANISRVEAHAANHRAVFSSNHEADSDCQGYCAVSRIACPACLTYKKKWNCAKNASSAPRLFESTLSNRVLIIFRSTRAVKELGRNAAYVKGVDSFYHVRKDT